LSRAGTLANRGHVEIARGIVNLRRGELDRAERTLDHASETVSGIPAHWAILHAALADLRTKQGRAGEARSLAEDAVRRFDEVCSTCAGILDPYFRRVQIEALEAAGDHQGARVALAKAHSLIVAQAAKITDPEIRESFLKNVPERAHILELARARLALE